MVQTSGGHASTSYLYCKECCRLWGKRKMYFIPWSELGKHFDHSEKLDNWHCVLQEIVQVINSDGLDNEEHLRNRWIELNKNISEL